MSQTQSNWGNAPIQGKHTIGFGISINKSSKEEMMDREEDDISMQSKFEITQTRNLPPLNW